MHSTFKFWRVTTLTALIASGTLGSALAQNNKTPYLHAPSVTTYATHNPAGLTIISSGRYIKPIGKFLPVAKWPHGLVLSPDGKTAFVASEGVGQLITDWEGTNPVVTAISTPPVGAQKKRTNSGACAFSPDGKTLYWSSGESGEVFVLDLATREVTQTIALNVETNGTKFADSYAMDIKLSADGKSLYCADVTNFRVIVIDTAQQKVVGSVRVGRYPYALSVVGTQVYVANIGMFEYSAIPAPIQKVAGQPQGKKSNGNTRTARQDSKPDAKKETIDPRGLTFPPFGFPSKESRDGVFVEGRQVPGLGDPNVPESFSVWGVDASVPTSPKIISRTKTGLLVGAPSDKGKTVGGSAPNFLAFHGNALYVSNGNNDTIERLDLSKIANPKAKNLFVWKTRIRPSPLVAKLRGVSPAGMTVSSDGKRLYVAESGINAVAVLDTMSGKVLGHLPVGWYPYRVALSNDGKKLLCINFRGFGSGPNAGKEIPKSEYLRMRGMVNIFDIPTDAELKQHTENVLAYNGIVDKSENREALSSPVIPTEPGKASEQIKYVVFITKENHTYDTIFDRIPGAKHDPSLLRWGMTQRVAGQGQPTLENVAVMTNHNALARQFTVSDNFYMEPEASGVGHRWLNGIQPNNFAQMTYTLGWDFKKDSTAPGRRASFGSNGSPAPEDYPEAGAMWEHMMRHGKTFRNYGEGFEFAGVGEDENQERTGAREVVNIPMSKVLFDNTCRDFPIFNMNIPDVFRAKWFEEDFSKLYLNKAKPKTMPHFINICICNDHGSGTKPDKGYPYLASWMADNDLALGRIVDFLSHTKYWKNMAIFVTQDDSGGEPDHVDAQRSVLMVISPYAKRAAVSHRHTTIVSMHRTLYQILGMPPLNMFDALANDFADCFTTTPDFTPYTHVPVDKRIFDEAKIHDPTDPNFKTSFV